MKQAQMRGGRSAMMTGVADPRAARENRGMKDGVVASAKAVVLGLAILAATALPAMADTCDGDEHEPGHKESREASREVSPEPSRDTPTPHGHDAARSSAEVRTTDQTRQ